MHVRHNGHLKVLEECAKNDNNSPTSNTENALTSHEMHRMRLKSIYILILYKIILTKTGTFKTQDVFDEAVNKCVEAKWEMKSATTLQRWHSLYHHKGGLFSHLISSKTGKGKFHPFLELHSSTKDALKMFCRSNINSLCVENVHDFIIKVILSGLTKTANTEVLIILQLFCITKLCFSKVLKWMHGIGFRYSTRKNLIMWIITRSR